MRLALNMTSTRWLVFKNGILSNRVSFSVSEVAKSVAALYK